MLCHALSRLVLRRRRPGSGRLALSVLLTVFLVPALLVSQAKATPDALAKALQQRYDGIADFTAAFTQSYRGGVLRTATIEQGTVTVKKPGRMRWVYSKPEKKEFVSDGQKMYLYI